MKEKAILVSVDFESMPRPSRLEDVSKELEELSLSAGLVVSDNLCFCQKAPTASLFIGKGKVDEIKKMVDEQKANVVLFDRDLSSSQQRNLEEIFGTKTIDRTQLILDIFSQRAKSNEGKLQVELAQLKYLLPRLSGKGVMLSRLGGGVGTRGPGEQKLEVDRRRIRQRIARLSRELIDLQSRRLAGVERKKEINLPLIALVGYTNAGKSSVFNALTQAKVEVKNKLFSTLDTTTRLINLLNNQKALLVDTVGFIRELPHHLIESFKATLEEAVHADIVLHIIDRSRPDIVLIDQVVQEVLSELGVNAQKVIKVYNKVDLVSHQTGEGLGQKEGSVEISALTGEGLNAFVARISKVLSSARRKKDIFIPSEKIKFADYLYREGQVLGRVEAEGGSYFSVCISPEKEGKLKKWLA